MDLSAHPVSLILNDLRIDGGSGATVLGDPRIALTCLANELISWGEELKAGQIVTTGTCVRPARIKPGDRVVGDFGLFGTAEVVFTD